MSSQRIYYLSKQPFISNFMEKIPYKRIFLMRSRAQKKFLPKKTQVAIEELIKYNCEIKYIIR